MIRMLFQSLLNSCGCPCEAQISEVKMKQHELQCSVQQVLGTLEMKASLHRNSGGVGCLGGLVAGKCSGWDSFSQADADKLASLSTALEDKARSFFMSCLGDDSSQSSQIRMVAKLT